MSDPYIILLDAVKDVLGNVDLNKVILIGIIAGAILLILYIGFFFLLLKIKKIVFATLEKKKGKSLTLQFIEKTLTFALIVIFVVLPLGGKQIARSLLGSTAVVAAVVGFAAQEAVKNMFAGLQISIYKPFDVGSRVEFADGTTGVIESLNLRHVVVSLLDTTKAIIPNSSANSMKVISYSYGEVPRSATFKFPVSYDCDIDKAKEIIRKTICDCPLTINEDKYDEKVPNSRCVYFLSLEDSALIMGATVRFPSYVRSEVIKDEINTSVFKALKDGCIEIPYNKIDVNIQEKK
ncbi:mechanosensitive ion channel family protein [Butyrivibrio sp. DSM 10294]|uniref:mechanosensitive ion channel family protein n=1 Tax=Butyrivibrio sp. DSM 10294 TaxID=2972457 RepID=UPI00234F0E58|nr:mechanosensitive ion channel family protein [Butyrivibrio sp. DSM 10294]MDC7294913.1 mechanosensitive ion channel family protein [Butyrivibrio sp. DSM 10294]